MLEPEEFFDIPGMITSPSDLDRIGPEPSSKACDCSARQEQRWKYLLP